MGSASGENPNFYRTRSKQKQWTDKSFETWKSKPTAPSLTKILPDNISRPVMRSGTNGDVLASMNVRPSVWDMWADYMEFPDHDSPFWDKDELFKRNLRGQRTKSKIKRSNIKFFNTAKKHLNLIKGVSQTPMKHISKKVQAIDEPLEISHYIHDEIEEGCNTSSSDSSLWKTIEQW